jgi:hypothetical protein
MSELAVLSKWALHLLEPVLAELSFVFLFQGVELTLISIEVVVVGLLCQTTHHLSWWIVKISWPSICIETLCLIARLFT